MRTSLATLHETRATFQGTFARYGLKYGWHGRQDRTLLLTDIDDEQGRRVCDHLWFNDTKAFAILQLQPGDRVQFDGRITAYLKGYRGRRATPEQPFEIDYKLSHPTHVKLLTPGKRGTEASLPRCPPPEKPLRTRCATLTATEAEALYQDGLAFQEGTTGLVTRQALYEWDPHLQAYACTATGLRLRHRLGVQWDGARKRFVPCHCAHCDKYPEAVAAIRLATLSSKRSVH